MKSSKNVLQFMCYEAPYPGNFIKSLLRLDNTIKKGGIETVYLFHCNMADKDWVQDLIYQGKRIYFLNGQLLKDISILKKILVTHKIKFIHSHFTGVKYHILFNIARVQYDVNLCIIRHLHNHDQPGNFIVERIKSMVTHTDFYIGCSESVAIEFPINFKIDSAKVDSATNAIDFTRLDQFDDLSRENLNIGDNTTVFLMFGFDYHRKGVDLVLEAMHNLVAQKYDVCLLLSLSANRDLVESKIIELFQQIPPWLKIVNSRDDIGTYYRFSDCFLSASREEGFSYSLVEAAYCETPIITSDIPGPKNLDIPHAIKFSSENMAELQKAMLSVISLTDDQKKQITFDQKSYVIKTFDLDVWADRIFNMYKRLN
jgi:glycosyltransferase involved in cell wall biosynthesis